MKCIKFESLLTAVFLLIALKGFCQIKYEKGYFINNDGEKTEAFILNKDWKDNPTEFNYRIASGGETQTANISSVKEFGIENTSRYLRETVKVDRSNPIVEKLTFDKKPEWKEEELFLLALVEGPATLYLFEDGNLVRFFFSLNGSKPEQLIYKRYKEGDRLRENKDFIGQLNYLLSCKDISNAQVMGLRYQEKDLKEYFLNYNKCVGETSVVYEKKKKSKLALKATPGVSFTSLEVTRYGSKFYANTGLKPTLRLGLEVELILPFNKNKWSVFIEPTFQYFKSEAEETKVFYVDKVGIDYSYIDMPIGIRHYFYLNDNARIFINGAAVLNHNLNHPRITFSKTSASSGIPVEDYHNFAFGAGFALKKLSAEVRYFTPRELTWTHETVYSDFNNISLIVGYKIL